MILRILGEGQYQLDDHAVPALQELDLALEQAVDSDDDLRFRPALEALLEYVRGRGTPLADDALEPSDAVLPSADAHVEDVRDLLDRDGEGIIPDQVS